MGNYHLFAGAGYYPQQGLGDYVDSYEEEELASVIGKSRITPPEEGPDIFLRSDWYSVITERDGRLVEVDSGYRTVY